MSNKRLINIVGILMAVGLFVSLSGCGKAKSGAGESTITILIAEDPPSFNAMISDTGYDSLVMELVMLGMTDVDPQGKVFPELAAELHDKINISAAAVNLLPGVDFPEESDPNKSDL